MLHCSCQFVGFNAPARQSWHWHWHSSGSITVRGSYIWRTQTMSVHEITQIILAEVVTICTPSCPNLFFFLVEPKKWRALFHIMVVNENWREQVVHMTLNNSFSSGTDSIWGVIYWNLSLQWDVKICNWIESVRFVITNRHIGLDQLINWKDFIQKNNSFMNGRLDLSHEQFSVDNDDLFQSLHCHFYGAFFSCYFRA